MIAKNAISACRFGALLMLFAALPLAAAARPRPGDIPPDALGRDDEGHALTVRQHRGKVLVVTFWASWCGPCRRELPMLAQVQKAVGRDHIEVIAVNVNEPRRDYLAVVRRNNRDFALTYVHDEGAVAEAYGVESLPNMFIIGQDGVVEYTHIGYDEETMERFVGEILGLLPPGVHKGPGDVRRRPGEKKISAP